MTVLDCSIYTLLDREGLGMIWVIDDGENFMRNDCPEDADDRQSVEGWRYKCVKRVYEDALIAFIDLLGTRSLYEGPLPTEEQAKKLFNNLIWRFDVKFGPCFQSRATQLSFDISIFADSIVISERKKIPNGVEQILEFLLEYQKDLLVNYSVPSRAILARDYFFSFKFSGISDQSILGSPHTSISLCGGRGIKVANDCLKGLPIGVYVTPQIKSELTIEQQARVVPVRSDCPELLFIKMKDDIQDYLPPETLTLLREKPDASPVEIMESIKAAFQNEKPTPALMRDLKFPKRWEFLRSAVQIIVNAKWEQWILAHLGKQDQIVRTDK